MVVGVLIVDDHPIFREGLRRVIEQDPAFRVLGEAETGREAISLARRLRPDVVLMDLSLPDLDGISATASLRRDLPETEVVVLTGILSPTSVTQALQAGASGYLFKDTQANEVRAAIQNVVQGRVHLSPRVSEMLANQMPLAGHHEPLTEREQEVLQLLALGSSNKEIMQVLQITQATVKVHISHIFSKLGVQSRTQAVLRAMRLGLVTSSSSVE
ncbi:MAG TPA: response regulator transcription factor [Ktedonobacteraceae bacterium]|nr:response regulator transcription factor [Ktedonobacteraceae bacterium]